MSSTSFNVGLTEAKNSSRVLKPPGGGHTDIFGIRGNEMVNTPSKRKNQPQSTINSCFQEEHTKTDSKEIEQINTKESDLKNGNNATDENTEPTGDNEHQEKKKSDDPNPPRRGRVPPGGFSSGLW